MASCSNIKKMDSFRHNSLYGGQLDMRGGELSTPAIIQMNFLTSAMILGMCESFSLLTHLM
jgi:hypothetical protein